MIGICLKTTKRLQGKLNELNVTRFSTSHFSVILLMIRGRLIEKLQLKVLSVILTKIQLKQMDVRVDNKLHEHHSVHLKRTSQNDLTTQQKK